MTTYPVKILRLGMCTIVVLAILFGCAKKQVVRPAAPCLLPQGKLVSEAFSQAKSTLSNPSCVYKFDSIIKALLRIAEGDPNIKNKELFSDLLQWAGQEGIISTMQSKEYYSRYFSRRFFSLPDDYRMCSYCPRLKLSKIMSDLKDELRQKKQGLMKICKDKETFGMAHGDYQDLTLILEATCLACASEDR